MQQFFRTLPLFPWQMNVHDHAVKVTDLIADFLHDRFRVSGRGARSSSISQPTWEIHDRLTAIRRRLKHIARHRDLTLLGGSFAAWAGRASGHCRGWLRHRFQLACRAGSLWLELSRLSAEFRQSRKADRAAYVSDIADKAANASPSEIFTMLRPVFPSSRRPLGPRPLPSVKKPDGELCTDPYEAAETWRSYFSSLELGQCLTPDALAASCVAAQHDRCLPTRFDLGCVPSLLELERRFRAVKAGRAFGLDAIPPIVLKLFAPQLARVFFPVVMKMTCYVSEPLVWKGGELVAFYKGKGLHTDCRSLRSILLASTVGKAVHATVRTKAAPYYSAAALPLQAGGRPGMSVLFPAQALRCHLRSAASRGDSAGVVLFDVQSAFYSVLRHLAVGRTCSDADITLIVRDLGLSPSAASELRALLHQACAAQEAGVPEHLCSLLAALHSNTWFMYKNSPYLTATRKGSRPGDPLADLVFNFLFLQVLKDVHSALKVEGLVASLPFATDRHLWDPVFDTQVELSPFVWADDLALAVSASSPTSLPVAAARTAGLACDSLAVRGFTPNTSKGKTECLLAPRGPRSVEVRKQLFAGPRQQLSVLTEHGPSYSIGIVPVYRHLGGLLDAKGALQRELRARAAKATGVFNKSRKHVFANPAIPLSKRLVLLNGSVLSILAYGAGSWPLLNDTEFGIFAAAYYSLHRRAAVAGWPRHKALHLYNSEVLERCGAPDPQAFLHVARLRHLRGLLKWGPPTLWALLFTDNSAIAALQLACLWLWEQASCWIHMPHPQHEWADFALWLLTPGSQWKAAFRCARDAAVTQARREACTARASRIAFDRVLLGGLRWVSRVAAEGAACYACTRCGSSFDTLNAWSMHVVKKHSFRAQWSRLANGTFCVGCGSSYATTTRLALHLKRSFPCTLAFWSQGAGRKTAPPHWQAPPCASMPKPFANVSEPLHLDFLLELDCGPGSVEWSTWFVQLVQKHIGPLAMLRDTFRWWRCEWGDERFGVHALNALQEILDDEFFAVDLRQPAARWHDVVRVMIPAAASANRDALEFVAVAAPTRLRKLYSDWTLYVDWEDFQDVSLAGALAAGANQVTAFMPPAFSPEDFALYDIVVQCIAHRTDIVVIDSVGAYFDISPFSWLPWRASEAEHRRVRFFGSERAVQVVEALKDDVQSTAVRR